ncbi:heavy metal translocating P-type ATPase [Anaerococcus sp. AGMB09787]|uniref:heavy metal translocating P-type ATPase n=1 Tax=Anaerococcus sp. AGMB09787 TaxID=2922869 RepID=UPI001FAEF0AA|nr:heavy metal translocating P-type ATPase [Anaerococcus sp. AGMB09787]
MFRNMSEEHRHRLYEIIIVSLLALSIFLMGRFFFLGDLRKWAFLLIYLYSGREILYRAFMGIVRRSYMDENFLMALATITAFFLGEYFEAVAVIIFYSFGELFEDMATAKSREEIASLVDLVPETASVILPDGSIEERDIYDVEVGDILLVCEGEKVGVDGEVLEGKAMVDASSITGESLGQIVGADDEVLSSSIVSEGIIKIRATKDYDSSYAAKIIELIEDSASSKSKSERFVSRFARVYTPIVVGLAILIAVIPPAFMDKPLNFSLFRAATFLVLSCPCALVLSVPLSFIAGLGQASREGILIKGSEFFEKLDKADTLLLDKTGTITTGDFKIGNIEIYEGFDREKVLNYLVALESMSSHIIGKAIVRELDRKIRSDIFKSYENILGSGMVGVTYGGTEVKVGSPAFVGAKSGNKSVFISIGGRIAGEVLIEDEIRTNVSETIGRLKERFKNIAIVSGDQKENVGKIAEKLGIGKFYSEVKPHEKLAIMRKTKADAKALVFVGDGINDGPVLKNSDVGISMGETSSDIAIDASDVLITGKDFSKLATLFDITRLTNRTVRQNITFILAVKILILILGLMGYASMWLSIFGDVGVSIISILWAMRILKK